MREKKGIVMSSKRGKKHIPKVKNEGMHGQIIAQPSADDLRPSEEAREEQRTLLRWEKRSKDSDWVVGHPFRP
ncbi:MAG: hypothetical protein ACYS19_12240 [Planctomycetota bacterium]